MYLEINHTKKKMKRNIIHILAALFIAITASAASRVVDINTWKHYIAYTDAQKVLPTGNDVFVLSSGKLYSFSIADGYPSYREYSTINSLSDYNEITHIQYNSNLRKLIIVYANSNIDLLSLKDMNVVNISSILNQTTTSSKEVRNILCHGKYAYITMAWGIVIINMEKSEITDTYRLDTDLSNGEQLSGCWVEGDYIYVSAWKSLSDWGSTMIKGALRDNLLDKEKWTAVDANREKEIQKKIQDYNLLYSLYDEQMKKNIVEDKHYNCYWGVEDGCLVMCNKDGEVEKGFNVDTQKEYSKTYKPYGPVSNNICNIQFKHNNLYCVSAGIQTANSIYYDPTDGVVQVLNTTNDKWNTFETPKVEYTGGAYRRTNNLTIDPRDSSHVMVGGQEGLYEFKSGKFIQFYNNQNSPILPLTDGTSKTYQIVMGLEYDRNGRLWVLNSYCSRGILALDQATPGDVSESGNIWHTFSKHKEIDTFEPYEKYLAHTFFDSKGYLWFINGHCYDMAFYRYDTENDVLKKYIPSFNQDGRTIYDDQGTGWIRDIKEDNGGNIWIAGTKGVAYIPADEQETLSNMVYQHKVNRNDNTGLADYLLRTVDATSIVFDTNNRMYVSTYYNGVYVISADRNEELSHYTTENSDILSDCVYYLALDKETGVLYMSTSKGLCSVQTEGIPAPQELASNNIKVFPNPVTPDYTGPITIEGLPLYADVKIVTSTGALVHQGRSSNAYYQWDGCNANGDRCASGIYNILLTTSDGEQGCVAKFAMIK